MNKLILTLLSFVLSAGILDAQTVTHGEILGRPTDKSITVQAFFNAAVEVSVQYGTASGVYSGQTSWQTVAALAPATVVVSGLEPNTRYFYRMVYRAAGAKDSVVRAEHTFMTQRAPGSTFSFVVQADPHVDEQSDTALYRRCLLNQLNDKPDFMIDLGDILMSDKLKNASGKLTHDTITYRAHLLRSFYETSCHSVPLFIALGNHEGESGWNLNNTTENVAIWNTLDRKKYFTNPAPDGFYTGDETNHQFVGLRENYYSWQWGDALFIVLDPYWYTKPKPDSLNGWRWTLGKAQYDWLKATLEKSTAKFKFVFAHQLIGGDPDGRGGVEFADRYEWGGNNLNGTRGFETNRSGWYKPIKDLLTEHRVTIFFHGHDHFFGKQEKDCLIYQETPQPSHPNFQNAGQADDYGYFAGQILPNSGHIRVTVSPDGTKVDYVRAYVPKNETGTRKNGDVSATYFIGAKNCYDTLSTGVPVLWNSAYSDELVYPNPFTKATKIEFTMAQEERMTLSILDQRGTIVRSLLSGSIVAEGRYTIIWDGTDALGQALPSGMYWYALQGEKSGEKVGKIMLEK
ncbi:MAG: metallophosphoesterase [Candidatus Kapaibacterium sp.]